MELSLAVRDPLAACDESILARQSSAASPGEQGWRASFSPRVFAGSVGNGAHLHV